MDAPPAGPSAAAAASPEPAAPALQPLRATHSVLARTDDPERFSVALASLEAAAAAAAAAPDVLAGALETAARRAPELVLGSTPGRQRASDVGLALQRIAAVLLDCGNADLALIALHALSVLCAAVSRVTFAVPAQVRDALCLPIAAVVAGRTALPLAGVDPGNLRAPEVLAAAASGPAPTPDDDAFRPLVAIVAHAADTATVLPPAAPALARLLTVLPAVVSGALRHHTPPALGETQWALRLATASFHAACTLGPQAVGPQQPGSAHDNLRAVVAALAGGGHLPDLAIAWFAAAPPAAAVPQALGAWLPSPQTTRRAVAALMRSLQAYFQRDVHTPHAVIAHRTSAALAAVVGRAPGASLAPPTLTMACLESRGDVWPLAMLRALLGFALEGLPTAGGAGAGSPEWRAAMRAECAVTAFFGRVPLLLVIARWADERFVLHADMRAQLSLTVALLLLLDVAPDALMEQTSECMLDLLDGVSKRFSSQSRAVQVCGRRVGEAVARRLTPEQPLHFDDEDGGMEGWREWSLWDAADVDAHLRPVMEAQTELVADAAGIDRTSSVQEPEAQPEPDALEPVDPLAPATSVDAVYVRVDHGWQDGGEVVVPVPVAVAAPGQVAAAAALRTDAAGADSDDESVVGDDMGALLPGHWAVPGSTAPAHTAPTAAREAMAHWTRYAYPSEDEVVVLSLAEVVGEQADMEYLEPEREEPPPAYIGDALRAIQDKKAQAPRVQAALQALPGLIAHASASVASSGEARDMVIPVLRVMLTLDNQFGLAEFEAIRSTTLRAAVRADPARGAAFLTRCVFAEERTLGSRIDALDVLVDTAQELSGTWEDPVRRAADRRQRRERQARQALGDDPEGGDGSGDGNGDGDGGAALAPLPGLAMRARRTRVLSKGIQRPGPAEANAFASVAHRFVLPLLAGMRIQDSPVDLLGEDHMLLARLLHGLAVLLECARLAPRLDVMVVGVLSLASQTCSHETPGVRRATLAALLAVMTAISRSAAVADTIANSDAHGVATELAVWAARAAREDPDDLCRASAMAAVSHPVAAALLQQAHWML